MARRKTRRKQDFDAVYRGTDFSPVSSSITMSERLSMSERDAHATKGLIFLRVCLRVLRAFAAGFVLRFSRTSREHLDRQKDRVVLQIFNRMLQEQSERNQPRRRDGAKEDAKKTRFGRGLSWHGRLARVFKFSMSERDAHATKGLIFLRVCLRVLRAFAAGFVLRFSRTSREHLDWQKDNAFGRFGRRSCGLRPAGTAATAATQFALAAAEGQEALADDEAQ